jgi:hypothetical protein
MKKNKINVFELMKKAKPFSSSTTINMVNLPLITKKTGGKNVISNIYTNKQRKNIY